MKNTLLTSLCLLPALCGMAAVTTWTGTESTAWSASGNWTNGTPSTNWERTVTFSGTPTANQPDLGGITTSNQYVHFNSAGWTISNGNFGAYYDLISSGAGINTVTGNFTFAGNSGTPHIIQIDAGNTFEVQGHLTFSGSNTYQGTGSLVVGSVSGNSSIPFSLYVNDSSTNVSLMRALTPGATFGGNAAEVQVAGSSVLALGAGTFLSPGYGSNQITTMAINNSWAGAGLDLTGATLVMDLGTTAGVSDLLQIGLTRSGGLNLGGATLALRGTTLANGDYTLLQETTGAFFGSFGSITYNGVAADPSVFSLTDNGTSMVLSVTVPEPSTIALLMGMATLGLVFWRRRQ